MKVFYSTRKAFSRIPLDITVEVVVVIIVVVVVDDRVYSCELSVVKKEVDYFSSLGMKVAATTRGCASKGGLLIHWATAKVPAILKEVVSIAIRVTQQVDIFLKYRYYNNDYVCKY